MKRLVDLVDRGPRDDIFYPAASNNTIFRRSWPIIPNTVPEIMEIGYLGHAAWGQRITVPLSCKNSGDLLQWICLRLKPRSWLGSENDARILSGNWSFTNRETAWCWAASLGSIAIEKVELEIGDTVIEKWPGWWIDLWSRIWLDGGRAPVWDSDLLGQLPIQALRSTTRPPWTNIQPTDDGYVYCWLPLTFLRRGETPFPLISVAEQEVRLHITLRPFADVVRRRVVPRSSPNEVPIGEPVQLTDFTGLTPIPRVFSTPTTVPGFEDATVFVGVAHMEDPHRTAFMRSPAEYLFEPICHMMFDVTDKVADQTDPVTMRLRLTEFNGPIRELCWFVRRKAVWRYNEWTNYGALLEDELIDTIPPPGTATPIPHQRPLMTTAKLYVDNAVWRTDTEGFWRLDYGLAHRGGVRVTNGMVYGFILGDGADWRPSMIQPASTVNSSRADLSLEITVQPPAPSASGCGESGSAWEVHVFGTAVNWLRIVGGQAGPLFKD